MSFTMTRDTCSDYNGSKPMGDCDHVGPTMWDNCLLHQLKQNQTKINVMLDNFLVFSSRTHRRMGLLTLSRMYRDRTFLHFFKIVFWKQVCYIFVIIIIKHHSCAIYANFPKLTRLTRLTIQGRTHSFLVIFWRNIWYNFRNKKNTFTHKRRNNV